MATEGSSTQDGQRVVLLGKIGPGKSSLANRILGREIFKTEEIGLCRRKQGEHAGRKLTVVDTPGWDRVSVLRTPGMIKQEIIQSASLCLPGPHALLLVLPISMHDQPPSANDIESASHHVELLSHRAWRHTIVLFVCRDEMDTSAIDQQVQGAKKLIDKCEGRYFIFQNDSDVTALLQKIEDMVEENCGDFLMPQVYYEEPEKRMPSGTAEQNEMHEMLKKLKQQYRRKCEKMGLDFREQLGKLEQKINVYNSGGTMRRRRSSEFLPPDMAETHQGGAAVQHLAVTESFMVLLMGFFGALVGAILGATDGVQGSVVGVIFGSTIGVLFTILFIRLTREEELKQLYRRKCEKMELDFREQLGKLEQEINYYKSGGTMRRRRSSEYLPPDMAETTQGSAAVQHQDSVKETGAENEESQKRIPSGIAEQIKMYRMIVEVKQLYRGKCEKMELDFREQLGKLEQKINDYKSGGTMRRRRSSEFLPPDMAETSQGGAAVQQLALNETFVIVMMAFLWALVGAIVGATDGVQGSVVGVIFGGTIGVLLAILCFRLTRFVLGRGRVILSVRSDSSCSSKSTEKCKKQ